MSLNPALLEAIIMSGNLNATLILLDGVLEEIENGFVACDRCGDQESTKDLDFVSDLRAVKAELEKYADNLHKGEIT